MHLSHSDSLQCVALCTLDHFCIPELWGAPNEVLSHLFPEGTRRPPCGALDVMSPWRGGQMAEAIPEQFITPKVILVVDFKFDFWPSCK